MPVFVAINSLLESSYHSTRNAVSFKPADRSVSLLCRCNAPLASSLISAGLHILIVGKMKPKTGRYAHEALKNAADIVSRIA